MYTNDFPFRFALAIGGVALLCGGLSSCTETSGEPTETAAEETTSSNQADAGVDVFLEEPDPEIVILEGCGDNDCSGAENELLCPDDCSTAPVFFYEPLGDELTSFPDDFFTYEASTLTGLQVDVTVEDISATMSEIPEALHTVLGSLSQLDGWGTSGGAVLRFDAPIDPSTVTSGEASLEAGASVFMGTIDDAGVFTPVGVEALVVDDNTAVVLRPMTPLPPASNAIAGVTSAVLGADGQPVRSNQLLRRLLVGEHDAVFDAVAPRYGSGAQALRDADAITSIDSIAAMTVFTTQSLFELDLAIAELIEAREHVIAERDGCELDTELGFYECSFSFEVANFRDDARHLVDGPEPAAPSTYSLDVHAYLPAEGEGPFPVVIYQHGLSDRASNGWWVGANAAYNGFAVVGIDAPSHGIHPTGQSSSTLTVLDFFGLLGAAFDGILLRDNFRQGTFDRLALVDLLMSGVDVDGDNIIDLEQDDFYFFGVSLGAIMGTQFLALTDHIEAAFFGVGGARVIDIVQFSESFEPFIQVAADNTPQGLLDRLYPSVQAIVERGDGVNYAPHILRDSLIDRDPIDLLLINVIDDEIVTETTNFALARALGIPHLGTEVREVGLIDTPGTPFPVSNNLGDVTAGLIQMDWVPNASGSGWEVASHMNAFSTNVPTATAFHFFRTHYDTGTAEIIDPYSLISMERPAPRN